MYQSLCRFHWNTNRVEKGFIPEGTSLAFHVFPTSTDCNSKLIAAFRCIASEELSTSSIELSSNSVVPNIAGDSSKTEVGFCSLEGYLLLQLDCRGSAEQLLPGSRHCEVGSASVIRVDSGSHFHLPNLSCCGLLYEVLSRNCNSNRRVLNQFFWSFQKF